MKEGLYQASVFEQFAVLREQTRITGALHEAQVMQLKVWPLALFDATKDSGFTWEPVARVVTFMPVMKKRSESWMKPRLKTIFKWTQDLLGGEWQVVVKANGKTYRSSRKPHGDDSVRNRSAAD